METQPEKQITRLEKLKEEIESGATKVDFEGYDRGRESAFGLIDREMTETHAREYKRFRHIIYKKGFGLNKRRSEMEIIATILDIAGQGIYKTNILYKANLSYTQLKNYVAFLLEKGLLEHIGNKYSTTNKGRLFLITWQNTLVLLE
jgi:predicted transcriptional regulator